MFDLLTDLLALMCYQNYRFPVELQLGSQRCVFDCRLEQHQREGKRDSGMRRARGRVSAATNPIISFLRGLGKSNGWLGQSWGPVIHCTHFLCQYVPLTPTHPYHEDISLSPPLFSALIQRGQWSVAHVDIGIRHVQALQSTYLVISAKQRMAALSHSGWLDL